MSPHSRRILYLCSSWPLGQTFGGQLRALQIGRALKQMGEVTVKVVGSDASDAEAERRTRDEFSIERSISPRVQPNRSAIDKLRWAFDSSYLNLHGFLAAPTDRENLLSSFADYDLLWVLNSRTPNILQILNWPKAHLDLDDLPSSYLGTVASNGASHGQRLKARVLQVLFKRRELLFKKRFTTLSVCSQADRAYLGSDDRIHVIPNGFERPATIPMRHPMTNPFRIGFIGLCSHAPNNEGIRWFLKKSWPAIRQAVPGIRFRLIGRGADSLASGETDVDTLGWMANPAEEIATWSAMIIPIQTGAGTRVKIAEGLSRKCPMVSTSLGAYGYDVRDGEELLLADTAERFAEACIRLVKDPAYGAAIAERGYQRFLERWTWDAIAPRVWEAAEDCLRRSHTSSV